MEISLEEQSLDFLIEIMENWGELVAETDDIPNFDDIADDLCLFLHMLQLLRREKPLAGLLIHAPRL